MNSEIPSQDDKDEITSLVTASTHELSTRASIVTRGLQEILTHLRADSLKAAQDKALELHKEGRFADSVAACSAGLEIDPTDEILWQIEGVSLAMLGKAGEGLKCLDRILQTNTENPHFWALRAALLRRLNRAEERMECWHKVIRIEVDFRGAWKEIGSCLLELGRYEEAVEAFDSGLTQNPSDEGCRSQKEIALTKLAHGQEGQDRSTDRKYPSVIVTLGGWWTESYYHAPAFSDMKYFNFVCEVQNVSDQEQLIGKRLTVLQRAKRTGDVSNSAEATLLELNLPLRLAPKSSCKPVALELLWPFPAQQSDENCLREMFNDSYETIAYDEEFGTVVLLLARQTNGIQGVSPEPAFVVVYDSNKGWDVMNEDDVQWELVGTDNGRERWRPLQMFFGPFFSNYDPNEGPVGSGKALAEALAKEKRRLFPNGPHRVEPGS